ncbi:MAG: molybdenum cofactor biosynthesis protein MoaE [Chloroflexota bacterium]|nr:molybdenum cofactor biosynthesis protein MoaE [Chloroflexota bacterium]
MYRITREPLQPQALAEKIRNETHGAVVTFEGIVRGLSEGRKVLYLEYDAYPGMAESKLREVGDEIRSRWGVEEVAIHHRVGRVEVGETSLVVVVAAPHRKEAFAACQYAVDRIKEIVPIWKKEVWEGGEEWVAPHS